MKARVTKIIALVTLLLFVNLMFSNTVFIHSHTTDDGRTVTHSHPYLPSSNHSHSPQSLSLISLLNLTASAVEAGNCLQQFTPALQSATLRPCHRATDACGSIADRGLLRAPPFVR